MGTVEGGVGRGEGGGGGEEEEVGATFSVVDTSRRAEDSVSATQRQSNKEQNISTHTHTGMVVTTLWLTLGRMERKRQTE